MKRLGAIMVSSALLLSAVYFFPHSGTAIAKSECDFYRPTAGQDIETVYKGELEAEVARIYGLALSSGSLEGEYRRLERDTLYKYDDEMKMFVVRSIIHLKCEQADGQLTNEDLEFLLKETSGMQESNPSTSDPCSHTISNIQGDVSINNINSCND